MTFFWVLLISLALLSLSFGMGRRSRNSEVAQRVSERQEARNAFKQCSSDLQVARKRISDIEQEKDRLQQFITETISKLRQEGSLLPHVVRWATRLQEEADEAAVTRLTAPPHPAPSAAIQVKEAKATARQFKEEAELLRNRIDLYEQQAPWLREYAEFSLEEIIEGIRETEAIRRAYVTGDDPARLFLSAAEWASLSESGRNQLALDRYWEVSRRRTAWAAGIQYERFVGYRYECDGYSVEYHGAIEGKNDLGIDLICKDHATTYIIQCKRLSPTKEIPVRENAIAQTYGAAMFYALIHRLDSNSIKPVVYTTYQLSATAKQFATMLGVGVYEHFEFKPYPCIKCNIAPGSKERIYHLPFDQQYDRAVIGNVKGEFYAMTVAEAEAAGFRRAWKWRGNSL